MADNASRQSDTESYNGSTTSSKRGASRRSRRQRGSDKDMTDENRSESRAGREYARPRRRRLTDVKSNLSVVSKAVKKGFKKIKRDTGTALGVGEDVDYEKLKLIQQKRAENFSGVTREDRHTEELVNNLANEAGFERPPKNHRRLKSNEIKAVNEAFQQDIKQYQHGKKSNEPQQRIPSRQPSSIDIDEVIDAGADVDEEVYGALLDKQSQPSIDRKSVFKQFNRQQREASGNRLRRAEEFQQKYISSAPASVRSRESIKRQASLKRASASATTLYENWCRPSVISKAGYCKTRFQTKKQSDGRLDIEFASWDGDTLVSSVSLVANINKDYERATETEARSSLVTMDINNKALINPGYKLIQPTNSENRRSDVALQPSKVRKPIPPKANAKGFLYGEQGYAQYVRFRKYEKDIQHQRNLSTAAIARKLLIRQQLEIEDALEAAKEHYSDSLKNNSDSAAKKRLKKIQAIFGNRANESVEELNEKDKEKAVLRTQLASIRIHEPWFIFAMTFLQALSIIALILLGGITRIGITPIHRLSIQETWAGEEEVENIDQPNIWIGPHQYIIIKYGAVFAPCMRSDKSVSVRINEWSKLEALEMGCCEFTGIGAGTTTEDECYLLAKVNKIPNYLWRNGTTCEGRKQRFIVGGFEVHKFRPCCYGKTGDCKLVTHAHCQFLNGRWHMKDIEHCSQAYCDGNTCHVNFVDLTLDNSGNGEETEVESINSNDLVGAIIGTKAIKHSESADVNHSYSQIWRLPLSLLYHHGLVQFMLVVTTQLVFGIPIEKLAGGVRVGIIYIVSGLGGLMAGAALQPLEATVGAGGAVSGLIGVNLVELIQSWHLVNSSCTALLKILGVFLLFLISGLLPQVNQFVQLIGFIFGILLAIICLPYVTFQRWHSQARFLLICIAVCVLVTICFVIWFTFYRLQPYDISVVQYANCVPFIKDSCPKPYNISIPVSEIF